MKTFKKLAKAFAYAVGNRWRALKLRFSPRAGKMLAAARAEAEQRIYADAALPLADRGELRSFLQHYLDSVTVICGDVQASHRANQSRLLARNSGALAAVAVKSRLQELVDVASLSAQARLTEAKITMSELADATQVAAQALRVAVCRRGQDIRPAMRFSALVSVAVVFCLWLLESAANAAIFASSMGLTEGLGLSTIIAGVSIGMGWCIAGGLASLYSVQSRTMKCVAIAGWCLLLTGLSVGHAVVATLRLLLASDQYATEAFDIVIPVFRDNPTAFLASFDSTLLFGIGLFFFSTAAISGAKRKTLEALAQDGRTAKHFEDTRDDFRNSAPDISEDVEDLKAQTLEDIGRIANEYFLAIGAIEKMLRQNADLQDTFCAGRAFICTTATQGTNYLTHVWHQVHGQISAVDQSPVLPQFPAGDPADAIFVHAADSITAEPTDSVSLLFLEARRDATRAAVHVQSSVATFTAKLRAELGDVAHIRSEDLGPVESQVVPFATPAE